MRTAALVALALLSACSEGDSIESQVATLESLTFEVPADWVTSPNQVAMTHSRSIVWVPPTNAAKESLAVIRAPGAALQFRNEQALAQVLSGAQRALASVRASRPVPVKAGKLSGLKLDVDFVPPGTDSSYRRMHVLLIDGDDLIHVLYTTKDRSGDLRVLDLALNTLQSAEEGDA